MSFNFRSLLSSSAGNAVALWNDTTRVLVDCGARSQKALRALLAAQFPCERLDAVVVTHAHGDHVNYSALRVLSESGVPIYIHSRAATQLESRHCSGRALRNLRLVPFDGHFNVGEFLFEPIPLAHNPALHTVGFSVRSNEGRGPRAVLMTDFCRSKGLAEHIAGAELVYIEANHDMELLRLNFNPNSRYHMPNPRTGQLLRDARAAAPIGRVVLGHLSDQRNDAPLALAAVRDAFTAANVPLDFDLSAAPLAAPGPVIAID